MGAVLKYWRESASLIMASKRLSAVKPKEALINKMFGGKNNTSSSELDESELLRLLYVRRSAASTYMPNVYVFPGGMVDDTDFSKDWLDIFCYNSGSDLLDLFTYGKAGSPLFTRIREPAFRFVPSEIALRITAIRETFEECGVLMARNIEDIKTHGTHKPGIPTKGNIFKMNEKDLQKWRLKVADDPSQFMKMCTNFGAVPDIWSLYEWSNWLTPLLHKTHRFDTAFFVTCVDEGPQIEVDKRETEHGVWMDPARMLQASAQGSVSLAPPQMYEMCRIIRFASVDDLLALASHRAKNRSDRWMPVVQECKDGLLFLLPGDELYPENPDFSGEREENIEREETFDELSVKHSKQNRAFISYQTKQLSLCCNLEYLKGHILPKSFNRQPSVDYFSTKSI